MPETLEGLEGIETLNDSNETQSPELGQETSQTPPTQEPELTEDNAEKSKLGRKVKSLEEEVRTLTRLLQEQKEMMSQLLSGRKQEAIEEPEEEIPDIPTTRDDVLKIIQWYEKQKEKKRTVEEQQKRQNYEKTYASTLSALLDSEDHVARAEIYRIWKDKYNTVFTNDPAVDAAKGFMLAKNDYLKATTYKGRAETPQHPTISSNTTYKRTPTLSPEAEKLARYLNLSDEDIEMAMNATVIDGSKHFVKSKK